MVLQNGLSPVHVAVVGDVAGMEILAWKEEGRLQNALPASRSASCFSLFSAACPVPEADALLREAEISCKALLSSFLLKKKK